MSTKVVNSIECSVVFNTRFLFSIKKLTVAGFESRHKAVVNDFIASWNNTFGAEDTLEYPEDLRIVLQKLQYMTELRLPTFPERTGEEVRRLSWSAEIAGANVSRSCLCPCVSLTPKMKKRCQRSLSCLLSALRLQLTRYKALQSLSKVCGSVRIQEKLLRSEVPRHQRDGE